MISLKKGRVSSWSSGPVLLSQSFLGFRHLSHQFRQGVGYQAVLLHGGQQFFRIGLQQLPAVFLHRVAVIDIG